MGEFRIGRTFARHSYPDTRAATSVPYARNFAAGPAVDTAVATAPGTQVPWSAIEVGAPGVDVPITPKSTGVIHVDGVISVHNTSELPVDVQVEVQIGGVQNPVPASEKVTVAGLAFAAIPFNADIVSAQAVGVTKQIEILLIASASPAIQVIANSSSIEVLEEPVATG